MDAAKIVVHGVNRNGMAVVFHFLAESVRQSSETPHRHPHGEVLKLHVRRAHVLRVEVSAHNFHVAAEAGCGNGLGLVGRRSAVDFVKLSVIRRRQNYSRGVI